MINKKLVNDFAILIGNLKICINLDSYGEVKKEYEIILDEILKWIRSYYKNKNLDIVTHENSLEIHNTLEEIKWKILPDKNIGDESLLSDDILIRYEVIIKTINNERSKI
ncbi:MAG: hypothetical protein Q4E69_02190 [Bacilli bacterium]|nr:hypothetical protein [Bacilli bacterium]